MPSSCNIIVADGHQRIQLFRQCQGYPKAVIPDLRIAVEDAHAQTNCATGGFAEAVARALVERGGGNIILEGHTEAFMRVRGEAKYVYDVMLNEGTFDSSVTVYRQVWLGLIDPKTISLSSMAAQ